VKICIAVVIGALIFCVLALKDPDANAGGGSGPELSISYKRLRAYDQDTNTFTGVSYLVKSADGPGCSAVLAVDASSELAIDALAVEDGLHTWSGTRRDFSATGLPNPCP
jgi:hypothetical protein